MNCKAAAAVLVVSAVSSCAMFNPQRVRAERETAAASAVQALREARFDDAEREAAELVRRDGGNSRARAVWAIAAYRQTLQTLASDVLSIATSAIASGLMRGGGFNVRYLNFSFGEAEKRLAEIEGNLGEVAKDSGFSLDLCLACWEVDWNRNGKIDGADRTLMQVERDADGKLYPQQDPRRIPTFRFDAADASWLQALVNFQRGVLQLARAYDVGEAVNTAVKQRDHARRLRVPLKDRATALQARDLFLRGLEAADRCRMQVLAETDDEREWLPNPRQKQHPLPLPVDDALFQTWADVLSDLKKLLRSEEGLSLAELSALSDVEEGKQARGVIDLGRMLSEPSDWVLDADLYAEVEEKEGLEASLRAALGGNYRFDLKPSALPSRLKRMREEVQAGKESVERKLRYLLWLN